MTIKGGVNLYKKRNRFRIIYTLIFFISIVIIVFTMKEKGSINIDFLKGDIINYEFQWDISKESDVITSITHVVDEDMIKNKFLFFRSNNKEVKVYIDEKEIYNYGQETILFLLREWTWHTIEIKEEYLGGKLKIVNDCHEVLYSVDNIKLSKNKSTILGYVLLDEVPNIIISIIFLFISIILFIGYLVTRNIMKNNKMLYLSISITLVYIMFIINSKVARLIVNNYEILNLVSCEIIMLIPMGIILHYLEDKKNRLPHIIEIFPILNFVVGNILYLIGFFTLLDVILLTKVVLIFEAIMFSIFFFEKIVIKGEKDNKKASIGFIVMSALLILDLIKNSADEYKYYFYLSKIGIALYILSLVYDVFTETLELFVSVRNTEVYKRLAYNDILTGVSNRLAFESHMDKISKDNFICKKTLLIMIDINNLKYINDSQGHEYGDKYIIDNIKYIEKNVDALGKIYRTGGDEFVIIASKNNREVLEAKFKNMEDKMRIENSKVNFAYGFATFNSDIEDTIYQTLKRADQNMYINKNKMKKLNMN